MAYTHLTAGERYQISALRVNGRTLREIGEQLGRDQGTISRELRRNLGERGYRPKQANEKAQQRCAAANSLNVRSVPKETWEQAQAMLRQEYSPEQVSGRLRMTKSGRISYETIYLRIYADKAAGGDLYKPEFNLQAQHPA